ncbi:MAG TPA: hypothetical protein ENG02_00565 [Candidatus Woesearchaeota archaeon]|nr:hypothetical protein [Candidatus Woesearchaeota archaeon]
MAAQKRKTSRTRKIIPSKFFKLYSEELGIKLKKPISEKELFKWFLSAILFGKPIQESVAKRTILCFFQHNLTSPEAILSAGWDRLVAILDEGGYVRYDFSTATKLLEIMQKLKSEYNGKILNIFKRSKSYKELEKRLLSFKGIGPTTINIFLRELRHIFKIAEPPVTEHIKKTAKLLNINLQNLNKHTKTFVRLECALHRFYQERKKKLRQKSHIKT